MMKQLDGWGLGPILAEKTLKFDKVLFVNGTTSSRVAHADILTIHNLQLIVANC